VLEAGQSEVLQVAADIRTDLKDRVLARDERLEQIEEELARSIGFTYPSARFDASGSRQYACRLSRSNGVVEALNGGRAVASACSVRAGSRSTFAAVRSPLARFVSWDVRPGLPRAR
jgi:hypothetical protein